MQEDMKNCDFRCRFISEMIRNKAIATMKAFLGFQMVPVSINLSVTSNPDFRSQYYLTPNSSKMVQDRAILTMANQ